MENKRISVVLVGGLGNQLFQIASAYGISLIQCKKLQAKSNKNNPHSSLDYFTSIFRKIEKTELSYVKFIEPSHCFTNKLDIPIYALGGLNPSSLSTSWQYGGHGIAMKTAIWE